MVHDPSTKFSLLGHTCTNKHGSAFGAPIDDPETRTGNREVVAFSGGDCRCAIGIALLEGDFPERRTRDFWRKPPTRLIEDQKEEFEAERVKQNKGEGCKK